MLDEFFQLIWNLITFPFRLIGAILKTVIFGPLLALAVFIVIIGACVALLAPAEMPRIETPTPAPLIDLTSLIRRIETFLNPEQAYASRASQVTCGVRDGAVLVEWNGATATDVAWYLVYRKTVPQATWQRIAAIPAAGKGSVRFEYVDRALQRGVTYQYGVIAARADGSGGELVVSPVQVVAP
jgi:hypothetical protein